MSMIPRLLIETAETQTEQPSLTYRLDPERKRIIGMVDGLEAANQAIWKALITPRFLPAIYSNQYGSEIKQALISGNATEDFIDTELPWFAEDALSQDTRIFGVHSFEHEFYNGAVHISFVAETIFGPAVFKGVM